MGFSDIPRIIPIIYSQYIVWPGGGRDGREPFDSGGDWGFAIRADAYDKPGKATDKRMGGMGKAQEKWGDFMAFHGDFNGIYWDFIGFHGDFMGFHGWFNGISWWFDGI